MQIQTNWLIHINVDDGSDADFDGPFVEIEDCGINEANEVRIRSTNDAMKFMDSSCDHATIWTREGIEMLHEACGAYLRAAKERD